MSTHMCGGWNVVERKQEAVLCGACLRSPLGSALGVRTEHEGAEKTPEASAPSPTLRRMRGRGAPPSRENHRETKEA